MKKHLLLGAALTTLSCTVYAADPVGQTVLIPMVQDGRTIQLEATLYKPPGTGPAPVLIYNHGSSGGPIPADYTDKAPQFAGFLLARGIGMLAPMRPGRGRSEGSNVEEPSPCTVQDASKGVAAAETALDATLAYLRTQTWADMQKLVLAGHSRGGLLSAAYAGDRPGTVRGVINFSGGWKDDRCASPDINVALFDAAGRKAKVPALFLYGRGDGFYSDASVERYAKVYGEAGADVRFHTYVVNGANGHLLFRRAAKLWEADADAFLRELGVAAPAPTIAPTVAPTIAP